MAEGKAVIIKRVKKYGGGHHGGAWKVAYADFVTAMMAFFLLLWLLNAVTEEQLTGIADYFAPTTVSKSASGAGGMLGGQTVGQGSMSSQGTTPSFYLALPPPAAMPRAPAAALRAPNSTRTKGRTRAPAAATRLRA